MARARYRASTIRGGADDVPVVRVVRRTSSRLDLEDNSVIRVEAVDVVCDLSLTVFPKQNGPRDSPCCRLAGFHAVAIGFDARPNGGQYVVTRDSGVGPRVDGLLNRGEGTDEAGYPFWGAVA